MSQTLAFGVQAVTQDQKPKRLIGTVWFGEKTNRKKAVYEIDLLPLSGKYKAICHVWGHKARKYDLGIHDDVEVAKAKCRDKQAKLEA